MLETIIAGSRLAPWGWAGRRLPLEVEWEVAAAGMPSADGIGLAPGKRPYPWGEEWPTSERANLDWQGQDCLDVDDLSAGDSAFGCRQMMGNVWEWTASPFLPYPGFVADPYKEYSAPWFGNHQVLRGGCWTTRARLLRNRARPQVRRRDRAALAESVGKTGAVGGGWQQL